MPKADTLIRTKLHLPFSRPALVERPGLQEQLAEGLKGPLTVIAAPAGFGKTTLAAAAASRSGYPVAWLSLDKDDNQVERFLMYLVSALQEAEPSIGNEAAQLVVGIQPEHPDAVLAVLINELEAAGKQVVLVLDEYQAITNQAVHEAVTVLVDRCPKGLHLLIASRSDPALPLSRWRARGMLVELRAADLRFSGSEASDFLNRIMGLRLLNSEVETLAQRTEGWIAGLQMAALSMRDREDVGEFLRGFSGTNRYIMDYLLEEVLIGQPAYIQQFLLFTSILERLNADLCREVSGIQEWGTEDEAISQIEAVDTQAILEYLERVNLFLAPLDNERSWYRYHPLFADLLRTQLSKMIGARGIAELQIRAAEWHAQHGSTIEAIHYASAASDDERVERFIEQNYIQLVRGGEQAWLRYWTGKLSFDQVSRRPWLCIYAAYSHSWFGELDEADRLLAEAEKRFQGGPTPESTLLMVHHAYLQSRVTAMRGEIQRAIQLCRQARSRVPAENLALFLDTSITLGYEYFLSGDFHNASQILEETIHSGRKSGAVINTVAAACLLGRMYTIRGWLNKACETYQAAGKSIPGGEGQHLGARGLVEIGMAEISYELNDLPAALEHVRRGLDLLAWWEKADDWILAYILLSRIHLAQNKQAEAQAALEKAGQFINSRGVFAEARVAYATATVRLWTRQDKRSSASRWADSYTGPLAEDPFWNQYESVQTMRSRVLVYLDRLEEAAGLIARLEESARNYQRVGRLIEIMILKSLVMWKKGEPALAHAALMQCLTLAEPEGYTRLFLDEGYPLRTLLAQWLAHLEGGRVHDYAAKLLKLCEAEAPATEDPHRPGKPATGMEPFMAEGLSQREMEVLQLIAQGKSNQEIARELVVAPGTVKAHTASIYRKLGASNRTEAAARARAYGLLP